MQATRSPVAQNTPSTATTSPAGRPAPESAEEAQEADNLLERAREAEIEQQAQLETAPVDTRYTAALVVQVEAKQDQAQRIEDKLETLIANQAAGLAQTQAKQPGLLAFPGARSKWQSQIAKEQQTMQRLETRLEQVREIRDGMGVHAPKIEELAARKLQVKDPALTSAYNALCEDERAEQTRSRQTSQQRGDRQRSTGLSLGLSLDRRP